MKTIQRACLFVAIAIALSGCAAAIYGSSATAPVCAVPVNRTVQSMYWLDCQSYASSPAPYSRHYSKSY